MRYIQNKGCLIFCKGDVNKQRLLNILYTRYEQNKGCLIFCKGDVTKQRLLNIL